MSGVIVAVSLFLSFPLVILACEAPAIVEKWLAGRAAEQLLAFKHSMVERGMSVDEIERVLAAGVPPPDLKRDRKKGEPEEKITVLK